MGSLYGYEVASELSLRRLGATPGVRGRLRLEHGPDGLLDQRGELTAWQDWDRLDDDGFALARIDGALLAWWSAYGTFEIDPAARRVRATGTSFDEWWEHRLATTVIPLLLAERGDLALHGAAIAVGGRGVLFCGPSGRGKSTLALLASRLGHPVLSEDGAIVELGRPEPVVWPGPRGVSVEDDATIAARISAEHLAIRPERAANGSLSLEPRRRRVRMLAAELEATGPAPVTAVCQVAERAPELTVKRLSPAEAVPALLPNLIHAGGPASLRPAFARLARLVEGVPVYRVKMPDRMSRAPAAARSLLARVAA